MNGSEIRQARERARLTQGELGEKVGVSGRTVGNWERGASIPRNRAARLVEVLNLDEQAEPANPLQVVSDATLLAEIARRFEEGRTREKAGDGSGNATPTKQAGVSPAPKAGPTADELEELRRRQREADETPIDEILGLAADHADSGETEHERQRREDND